MSGQQQGKHQPSQYQGTIARILFSYYIYYI